MGTVDADITCRKCGYNLRSLSVDGRCPECGTAVAYSVQGDFIRYSDPDWTASLRAGISLIIWGVLVLILVSVLGAVLVGATGGNAFLVTLASLVGQGMMVLGTWKLTEPDPSGVGEDQYGGIRKFIRVALLIGVAGTVLQLVGEVARLDTAFANILNVFVGLTALLGIVGFCCQLVYLSRLALRLPNEKISQRAHTLAWTIGISYGAIIIIGLVMALLIGRGGTPGGSLMAVSCAAGIAGIVLIVACVMYLLMLERFGKHLKAEEAIARDSWARLPLAST